MHSYLVFKLSSETTVIFPDGFFVDCWNNLEEIYMKNTEAYLEPSQISKKGLFAKLINNFDLFTIFA